MYATMVAELPQDESYEQEYQTLRSELGVDAWWGPSRRRTPRDTTRDPGAPPWWYGDEEASSGFMHAMGVT